MRGFVFRLSLKKVTRALFLRLSAADEASRRTFLAEKGLENIISDVSDW